MKKLIYSTLFILTTYSLVAQIRWDTMLGVSNKKEVLKDLIETYDGGYFICNSELNDRYSWEIKTDINGTILWDKTIGNIDSVFTANAVVENIDGGLIMVGGYWKDENSHGQMIMRLDNCGGKLWCNYFETSELMPSHFTDVIILDNSNILVLAFLGVEDRSEQVFLFCYNQSGSLLWYKPYATKNNYPEIGLAFPNDLYHFNDYYLISGYCYWPYPDNPEIYYLHPMIIKVDSEFNEEWLLPYGVNDSVFGLLRGVLPLSESEYMGYGKCLEDQDTKALIIQFDEEGNETGYTIVPNEAIDPPTRFNFIQAAIQISDSTFIAAANWGPEEQGGNPCGEYIFDLSGNISNYNSREGTFGGGNLIQTSDGNFLFGTSYKDGNNYDVYLYKLDSNLQSVPLDTNQYNYDSLCPHQITSGTIDLSDCMIWTNTEEIPSPEAYYANLKTIPIKVFPNPAKDKITFALENTDKHKNIQLQCYNIFGRQVHEQKIYTGQLEAEADVAEWGKGIYVVVVKSKGKVLGKGKFVVE